MKMHKNPVWLAFLTVISLVVLWYGSSALYKVYSFSRLSAETRPTSTEWNVKELADDQYIIKANYTFEVESKVYHGETLFKDKIFMNKWAAEQAGLSYGKKKWKVWFQPNAYSHSTLQKKVPIQRMLLCWGFTLITILLCGSRILCYPHPRLNDGSYQIKKPLSRGRSSRGYFFA